MDRKFIPVAMLAGALALAGCGGGSDAPTTPRAPTAPTAPTTPDTPVTLEDATKDIGDCETADCVDDVVTGAEADLSAEDLATLRGTADAKKKEIADGTPLTGLNVSAANQLVDALAGSEALQLGSEHIDISNAEPRSTVPWTRLDGKPLKEIKDGQPIAGLPGGWEGKAWKELNPAGSSGEEQDMRAWRENPRHISQKYEEFFSENADAGITFATRGVTAAPSTTSGQEGRLTLIDVNSDAFKAGLREALPSNFFTSGFARTDNGDDADTWELRGSFHGVPGHFICPVGCFATAPEADDTVSEPVQTDTVVTGIFFQPSNFDADETDVPALFAKLANPNFLNFGVYWTTVYDDDGDVTALRVDPFAGGGGEYNEIEDIVQTGTGNLTAKYSGAAAGTYVRTIVNDDNDREATGYGGFSADANLTAVFGTSKDTLTGTISDFVLRDDQASAGAAPDGSWEVSLKGDIGNGGNVGKAGDSFHAQFHGTVNTKAQSNGHRLAPYGLVGTFEHSFADKSGHVAGAFGTECDGGNCVRND